MLAYTKMSRQDQVIVDTNDMKININRAPTQTQLPWVEKYRPKCIGDIISHKEIIRSLKSFIKMETLPHLLFFGPSGSGKTSTIMCCANEIYGEYIDYMVMRLNASNERGIETVRTKIKNFVSNKNNILLPKEKQHSFKLVILDEIDSMTVEAQGMLRQTIEKNSETTRFCLICNEIDKINIALQSRCTPFRFTPLGATDMEVRLKEICTEEVIKCDPKAITSIIKISNGDMRYSINLLQSINITIGKKIVNDDVYKISGTCMPSVIKEIYSLLESSQKKKIKMAGIVDNICDIIVEHNVTIFSLLDELKNIILTSDLTTKQKIYLIDNFAINEIYDSININQKNIIMNIVSSFIIVTNIKN
jgi:replication factor C subunit 3/5